MLTADELTNAALGEGAAQKREELAAFVEWIRGRSLKSILEIGTMRGGTLKLWCELADDDATIISVDLPGGEWGGGYEEAHIPHLQSFAKPGQTLELIRGDSKESVDQVKEILGDRWLDLLFIDGDHAFTGVSTDYAIYAPLVRPGGFIVFHDILEHTGRPECAVSKLWAQLRAHFRCWEFAVQGDERGYGPWGGIGVLEWTGIGRGRSQISHPAPSSLPKLPQSAFNMENGR